MSLWLLMVEGGPGPHDDRSILVLEPTHPSAFRTGLFIAQMAGLLLGRHFQSPRQQRSHGRHRDVFHLRQTNVQPRTLLAPMLPHDDFSPALRQFLNAPEIFRRQFTRRHVASLQ